MNITASAVAGTLESSDIYVMVEPAETLDIEIQSVVYQQFGEQIRESILDVVREPGR